MIFLYQALIFSGLAIAISTNLVAQNVEAFQQQVAQVYHSLASSTNLSMASRMERISAQFLGLPYEWGPLGDGPKSLYDEASLYRLDAFDCETLVTTVLALSFARDLEGYKSCLHHLRYRDGKVGYLTRNHFTAEDWNKNNQNLGYIKDITTSILDNNQKPVAKRGAALIDKASWINHRPIDAIRLSKKDLPLQASRLAQLKAQASMFKPVLSEIDYIPLTALFDKNGKPNQALFKKIPNGAIIEIVRPNWDLTKMIGTHLNISHMGFAFWKNDQLIFRQASLNAQKVVDVSLVDYLKETLNSPTIKGINVQIALPKQPMDCHV